MIGDIMDPPTQLLESNLEILRNSRFNSET